MIGWLTASSALDTYMYHPSNLDLGRRYQLPI
eukprot:COSAG01_NODE_36601_length_515_cov_1.100962_1_plen_31_part_10